MDISQDYNNVGNNIVPCPICLFYYCPSKEGGKCPEEDNYKRAMDTKDAPNPITASRERIESDLMESEPIKRVLAIENLAIVTGRAREYHGKTIQEVLSQALLQHEAVVREEMERSFEQIISYIREVDPDDDNKQMRHIFDIAEAAIRTTQPTI